MNYRVCRSIVAVTVSFLMLGVTLTLLDATKCESPVARAAPAAATRYVAATGVDSGDCSNSASPCRTAQYAVDQSAVGDEIRIAAGTYSGVSARAGLTQAVYLSKTVTIRGGYSADFSSWDPAANATTLDAQYLGRVLYLSGNISPTIEGLRLTQGNALGLGGYYDPDTNTLYDGGGGVYATGGTPTLSNCQVISNMAGAGGGVALYSSAALIQGSRVISNRAAYGGGLALGQSDATVRDNLVTGNQADAFGGGVGVGRSAAQIVSNTITANRAITSGGGISVGESPATLTGNQVSANTARYGGGMVVYKSAAQLLNNLILSNTATSVGGGLNLDQDNSILVGNQVISNSATESGGGLFLITSTAAMTSNWVALNVAGQSGGAAFLEASPAWLYDNTILSNTANEMGGGLRVKASSAVIVSNTIAANTAQRAGGGLHASSGAAQVMSNTITGNAAQGSAMNEAGGGGVYVQSSDAILLQANDISANSARDYGGGLYLWNSACLVSNNTISGNQTTIPFGAWNAGGGGALLSGSHAQVTGNLFYNNVVTGSYDTNGGGLLLDNSDAILTNNRIISNAARTSSTWSSVYGGGVYVSGDAAPTLSQNEVFSNTALSSGSDCGGGIYLTYGAGGQIVSNTLAFNRSDYGGGLYLATSAGVARGNQVVSNSAMYYGGGLYVNYGTNVIQQNTVLSNTADIVGGGLALYNAENNQVVNNIFAANYAAGSNWFCNGGAGVAVNYPGPPMLHNTIVSNTGSAGLCFDGRSADAILPMTNTIIADHITGVYVVQGKAVLESTLWVSNTTDWTGGGTMNNNHPVTGTPDFVNPAAHDYHLGAASAALDAGANSGVTDDIDGDMRPADRGYDIGADERPGAVLRLSKTPLSSAANPGETITYTLVVASVGVTATTNIALTDTLPSEQSASSLTPSQGSCAPAAGWGGTSTCNLGTLSPGQSATATFAVQVTTTTPSTLPTMMRNTAWAKANETVSITASADVWLQNCHARINSGATDYSTVQAAVDAASPGDTVQVAGMCVGVNTYGGLGQHVYVNKAVTIRGGYTTSDWSASNPISNPTRLDALGQGRVVYVVGNINVALEGLELANGNARASGLSGYGGGVQVVSATLAMSQCLVSGNIASYGGGVSLQSAAAALAGNRLISNTAQAGNGGALYADYSNLQLTANQVLSNTATNGGGLSLEYSSANLISNTIASNQGTVWGGGLHLRYSDNVSLTSNALTTNTARSGGGLYLYYSDQAAISRNDVIANAGSSEAGGGMYLYYSNDAVIHENKVIANTGDAPGVSPRGGGGIFLQNSARADIASNQVISNQLNASGGDGNGGGGIAIVSSSNARVRDNQIVGNRDVSWGWCNPLWGSSCGGGGLLIYNTSNVQVSGNTISSNALNDRHGGGVLIVNGSGITLAGNSILSNTGRAGGGAYLFDNNASLDRNLVLSNTAQYDGGGVYLDGSHATLINTVIVNNQAGAGSLGSGVYMTTSSPILLHSTLAGNSGGDGSGLVIGAGRVAMTNTILVSQTVGVSATAGSTVTLNGVLWFNNPGGNTGGGGVVTVTNEYTNAPGFAADGYHLLSNAFAIDKGVLGGVTDDVDDQLRPNPNTGQPDLGADEFWVCTALTEVSINGPASGSVGSPLTFSAIYTPSNATPYIRYTWSPEPGAGQSTSVVTYTFATTGERVLQVTARNCGGSAVAMHTIQILLDAPGAPTLVSPPDGTVTTTQAITLAWQPGAGGTPSGYNVQLDSQIITTTNTTSATIMPLGVHTWTVRAFNATGYSAWAATWMFTVTQAPVAPGVPTLLSPPDGAITTSQNIVLSWQAGAGGTPDGYNVQLDGQIITTTDTTSATVLALGAHTWTVRAFNATGYSTWAAAWMFTVTQTPVAPGVPTLLSPPDGAVTTSQNLTLTWQAGAGGTPDGYNVQLDGQIITTTDTTSATVLALGAHTWTVRAFNATGYSTWAAAWMFTVTQAPVAPGVPTLLSPPDGAITTSQNIVLSWQAGAGGTPDGYNVQLDGQIITTTDTTSATVLALGAHTWTVRAFNAAGYSNWVTPGWTLEVIRQVFLPLVMRQ